ncbi:MAG: hypothetical protein ACJ8AW_30485 [Rhodopila sp.]|jgi:hypothetical protein
MPQHAPAANFFAPSDLEDEQAAASWTMPKLWPFATPGPQPPPPGASCSNCGGSAWRTERTGRQWGFRCYRCVPSPRPDDRIVVVETVS